MAQVIPAARTAIIAIRMSVLFSASFPVLPRAVRPKGRDTLEQIATLIRERYPGMSGLVYCLSRKECEEVAEELRTKHGIKVSPREYGVRCMG